MDGIGRSRNKEGSFFRRHLIGPLILAGAMIASLILAAVIFTHATTNAEIIAFWALLFWWAVTCMYLIGVICRVKWPSWFGKQ